MIWMGIRSSGIFCGVGVVGLLAFAIKGIQHSNVRDELGRHVALAREIDGLLAEHKTAAQAAEMQRRRVELEQQIEELHHIATKINRREPLLPDIFPVGEKAFSRVRFAELYRAEIDKLPGMLQGGEPPTPAEIEASRADLAEWMKTDRIEAQAGPPDQRRLPAGSGRTQPDLVTSYLRMLKSQRLRCYVDEQTFDRAPLYETGATPTVEELWFAQVGLWIQQDVVAAIADLNDDVARTVGRGASVAELPVKRLSHLYILGYQLERGLLPFPAASVQSYEKCMPARVSFTQRKCDRDFDVVVFRLVAVIDQRDLPQLIDRICTQNFYQFTAVSYCAVSEKEADAGYLYGQEPVIRVDLELEGYLWREIYGDRVPDKIKRMLAS